MNLLPASARLLRVVSASALTLGALAFTSAAHAQNYLFLGDYYDNAVLRFDATTGAPAGPQPFIPGYSGVEGISCVTGKGLLISNGSGVSVFSQNGVFLSTLVNTAASGASALSNDGKLLYITDEYSSTVKEIDTNTGAILATAPFPKAHDIAVDSLGNVYVTGYNNPGNGNAPIVKFDANLSSSSVFITGGDNGLDNPTGLIFAPDGSFYAVNNSQFDTTTTENFIGHYSAAGAFLNKITATAPDTTSALRFGFGEAIGPDGNLYVASLGNACVLKYDLSTQSYAGPFINVAPNGQGAKYLRFSSECKGVEAVPEPGAVAFGLIAGIGMVGMMIRGRRK